ncbi:MAG: succinylglutamate desuccinylase/aspartoacylase family protein [Devosia sp.]
MSKVIQREHSIAGFAHSISVFTVEGARPGPALALLGGVHGDELEGPVALSRLLARLDTQSLSGRLIIVPVCNPDAVAAGTRISRADGGNLARSFPGNRDGKPTERLAALLAAEVIAHADALVDLHSGGVALASAFFAGYGDTGPMAGAARAMAEAFGAPVIWRHGEPAAGRTLSEAHARGIPSIYVEANGGTFPDEALIEAYREGVLRVMARLGHIAVAPPAPAVEPLRLVGHGNIDAAIMAPVSGFLDCGAEPLQMLAAGEAAATITGLDGRVLAQIAPEAAGRVVFARRSRWVEKGETVLALAQDDR